MKRFFLSLVPDLTRLIHIGRGASRREMTQAFFFFIIGIAFWCIIFYGVKYVLTATLEIELLGSILARKVYSLVFITFFVFLLLSNLITALSGFFLSKDLYLLNRLPVDFDGFFHARFFTTLTSSSWHLFVFGTPVIAAYGVAFKAPISFYVLSIATFIPFGVICAAVGVIIIHILVSVFPAQKLRDFSFIAGIIIVALALAYIRIFIQPEKFINPDRFASFTAFVTALEVPESLFFPPDWIVHSTYPLLEGRMVAQRFPMMLISCALVLYFASNLFSRRIYFTAWSKAQEGKPQRKHRNMLIDLIARLLSLPFRGPLRAMVDKDTRLFMRDATQWTQLILIASLVVIYIVNSQYFRFIASSGIVTKREMFFLNLVLIAFILLSIAVRFVFPSISSEGKMYWLIRTSPLSIFDFLTTKLAVHIPPLFLISIGFTLGSLWIMDESLSNLFYASIVVFAMTLTSAFMGIGLGAVFPKFNVESIAKIPASYGGIVFMLSGGAIIMIQVFASAVIFYTATNKDGVWKFDFSEHGLKNVIIASAVFILVTAFSSVIPIYMGKKSLERYE